MLDFKSSMGRIQRKPPLDIFFLREEHKSTRKYTNDAGFLSANVCFYYSGTTSHYFLLNFAAAYR